MNKKWKKFEGLVKTIQERLSPDASVLQNEKIFGRKSGIAREVDVAVRQKIGQYPILIAIECKDYATPLDIKDVESAISLIDDIGANKGVIVASNGFTPAALARGKEAGLNLYSVVDTTQTDWISEASIPVILRLTKVLNCALSLQSPTQPRVPVGDIGELIFHDRHGKRLGTITDLFFSFKATGNVPEESGRHEGVVIANEIFAPKEYGNHPFRAVASMDISHGIYYRDLPLQEVSGFIDEAAGNLITKGFTTARFNISNLKESWREIASEDELAIQPVFKFHIRA